MMFRKSSHTLRQRALSLSAGIIGGALLLATVPIPAAWAGCADPTGNCPNGGLVNVTNPSAGQADVTNPSAGQANVTNPSAGQANVTNPSAGQANVTNPAGGQACAFVLGFAALDAMLPDKVGGCADNQTFAANGDAVQHAAGGLLVWRKADNWTAFTNGYQSWLNGPTGLQQRLNTQRFSWEADAASFPLVASSPAPTQPAPSGTQCNVLAGVNNPCFRNRPDNPNFCSSCAVIAATDPNRPIYNRPY